MSLIVTDVVDAYVYSMVTTLRAALPFARVTVSAANLRQAPTLESRRGARAGRGSLVRVVGRDGD